MADHFVLKNAANVLKEKNDRTRSRSLYSMHYPKAICEISYSLFFCEEKSEGSKKIFDLLKGDEQ